MAKFSPKRWLKTNMDRLTRGWTRQVEESIDQLERDSFRRSQAEENANSSQNGTLNALADTIYRQPFIMQDIATVTGFNLVGTSSVVPTQILRVSFVVPEGKTLVSLQAVGTVAAVDQTSGGVTSLYGDMLISAAGSLISPEFSPAKDTGASQVNNVLTLLFGRTAEVTPGSTVYASLRLRPLNPSAFGFSAGNYAALSLFASFTNPPRE